MSHHNKQQRKERIKEWKDEVRSELLAVMPMAPDQLHELLGYLDGNLEACDHTTKLTQIFVHVKKLDETVVLQWLREHGWYCDCEVLANLDDLDRELQRPPHTNYYVPAPKQKNTARDLHTATGWDLAKLPAPWRVGNLFKAAEPIQLQIGKKGGCTLQIHETPMPAGDQDTDEYWSKLWCARTKLPKRGPFRISHTSLELPASLRATVVNSPNWLPVFGWIIPVAGEWHLEFRTESNRSEGDLTQISALITALQTQS
jgi:Protein of unknown function (DUF2695)